MDHVTATVAVAQDLVLQSPNFVLQLGQGLVQLLIPRRDRVGVVDDLKCLQSLLLAALGGGHAITLQEPLPLGLGRQLLGFTLAGLGALSSSSKSVR